MTRKKSSLTKALQQHQNKTNKLLAKRPDETKANKQLIHTKNGTKTQVGKKLHPPTGTHGQRTLSMVNKGDRVLLIGEGNFSFTVTLVMNHMHPGRLITASTIDSKETVIEKYPDAQEYLSILEENQVTILFELDACTLNQDKRIKKMIKDDKFDKVIFNFPHVGGSEPDQDRSVRANQILILRFLRSVSSLLFQPNNNNHNQNDDDQMLNLNTKKGRKSSKSTRNKSINHHEISFQSDSDRDEPPLDVDDSDLELDPSSRHIRTRKPGTVLITTGTCLPYSLWDVPKLAKNGKILAHTILYPTHPNLKNKAEDQQQPTYKILRSFNFDHFISTIHTFNNNNNPCNVYQHRQTNGFKSFLDKDNDSKPGQPRTWELLLLHS